MERKSTLGLTMAPALAVMAIAVAASAYDSGNILSNPGFESGTPAESASNAMGNLPWMTSSINNSIAVTRSVVRGGEHSLEWKPIGWNIKDDGTTEDASTFIINNCAEHVAAGADKITVSGFANTSALGSDYSLQVILANDSFSAFNLDTNLDGEAEGWQAFEASMPVTASDTAVFLAFKVNGTDKKGAPGSAVYLDDLSLSYTGPGSGAAPEKEQTPETEPAPENIEVTSAQTRPYLMGFTPFSWGPGEEPADRTLRFVVANGDILCHHFDGGVPWTEALEDKPFADKITKEWNRRKDGTTDNVKVYVALTPLDGGRAKMGGYHGSDENMPLPEPFQGKTFSDPIVKKAYLNYCRRAVEHFDPEYLAIGIEVNELAHNAPQMWPGYLELHKHVYGELKKDYPGLPIFATMTLHNLLQDEWADHEEQQAQMREFLALNDIAGISFYSFFKALGPAARPVESFDWIREFVGDKPIAMCETTFPAEATKISSLGLTLPGSPEAQLSYYKTLLDAAQRDEYLFVVLFLYRDYDLLWESIKDTAPDWHKAWKDTGLLDGNGESRPAWWLWERNFARPYGR